MRADGVESLTAEEVKEETKTKEMQGTLRDLLVKTWDQGEKLEPTEFEYLLLHQRRYHRATLYLVGKVQSFVTLESNVFLT